jgi:excisionase family DNA binding protein
MAPSARPTTCTVPKAAAKLGVSDHTVRKWIRLGVLKAAKLSDTGHRQARWHVSLSSIRTLKKARQGTKGSQA